MDSTKQENLSLGDINSSLNIFFSSLENSQEILNIENNLEDALYAGYTKDAYVR